MIAKELFQTPWNDVTGRRGSGCFGEWDSHNAAQIAQSPFRVRQLTQDANRMRPQETARFRHVGSPAHSPEQLDAELRFQASDLRGYVRLADAQLLGRA